MSRVFRFAVWLSIAIGSTARGEEGEFAFSRDLQMSGAEPEELVAVRLDEAVFQASRDDLADLRITDSEGHYVPYRLVRLKATRERARRVGRVAQEPQVAFGEDGGVEIRVERKEGDPIPDAIRIVSPLSNFEQRVRVFSSVDGETWSPIGDAGVIFDYSAVMDVSNDEVKLPEVAHRYYRIVIDSVTSAEESQLVELTRRLQGGDESEREERSWVERRPFRIDRIEFWNEEVEELAAGDELVEYRIDGIQVEQSPVSGQTIITFDSPRVPLTRFQLVTGSRNFSRSVAVQGADGDDDGAQWRELSREVLSRIEFNEFQREELELSALESRYSRYRMVIENRDSPELDVESVRVSGPAYELVFLCPDTERLRLVYGASEVKKPDYDVAAIEAALSSGIKPRAVGMGEQQGLAVGLNEESSFGWAFLRSPLFLGSVVVGLVIVLGYSLYSASQRLDGDVEEDSKGT